LPQEKRSALPQRRFLCGSTICSGDEKSGGPVMRGERTLAKVARRDQGQRVFAAKGRGFRVTLARRFGEAAPAYAEVRVILDIPRLIGEFAAP
jgi:hypothetical protein